MNQYEIPNNPDIPAGLLQAIETQVGAIFAASEADTAEEFAEECADGISGIISAVLAQFPTTNPEQVAELCTAQAERLFAGDFQLDLPAPPANSITPDDEVRSVLERIKNMPPDRGRQERPNTSPEEF